METILIYFLIATILTIVSVRLYYKHSYNYWKKKGISTITPRIPFGNLENPLFSKYGLNNTMARLYREFRLKGVKMGGIYAGVTQLLMPIHPDAIKDIITTNYQNFASHGNTVDEEEEPVIAHLFNMNDQKWKDMRVKLTPTFTSAKMKMMFNTVLDCGKQLEKFLNDHYKEDTTLDIKEIVACYNTDVIGSCAFGVESNSFKCHDAEFRTFGRRSIAPNLRMTLRRYANVIAPRLVKLLKLHFLDGDTHRFFLKIVKDMVHHRKAKKVTRNDCMQLLINIEEEAKLKGKTAFTVEQMAAHAFVFFLGGFETSSSTMSFCLYELAHHQDIQDKLREEVNGVISKHDGNLTYDAIMEMKYFTQVIKETLRKYRPLAILTRVCTQDYQLSNGTTIEKGTKVQISNLGLHMDEEYFPNPDEFVPDRFSDENKDNILPYTFLPFGEGPRICIGLRFAMMQMKIGLSVFLRNYRVFPGKESEYPLELHAESLMLTSKKPVFLRAEKV